jgi:hypothetical protein
MSNIGFKLQVLLCIAAAIYFQFKENPVLKATKINIITHNDVVEDNLSPYKELIGSEYDGYRNHIYRVLTYSMHFLHNNQTNADVIASALVFHDIGLWTAGTLSYLEPGSQLARKTLENKYNSDQLALQDEIINNHHKFWPYKGNSAVEAVRKADWLDFSLGLFNKGMPRDYISEVQTAIPNAGFHQTLKDIGPRLYGNNVAKMVTDMFQIFKW